MREGKRQGDEEKKQKGSPGSMTLYFIMGKEMTEMCSGRSWNFFK